jgi:TrmH family RNA methyltransferase
LADIRRAINGDTLTDDGLLPVEGPKLIREARDSGLKVAALFVRSDVTLDPAMQPMRTTAIYELDQPAFRKIQTTESSQGLIALVQMPRVTLADLVGRLGDGPIVVLARLQDPGNAGTIIRVAESFGAAGCVGIAGTVGLYNSKVVRASAGSVFRLPCVWDVTLEEIVTAFQAAGIALIGTSPGTSPAASDDAVPIGEFDWRTRAAILIGNEGRGLAGEDLRHCIKVVKIPLCAPVESLNSAIAASLILYESFKQRGMK